MKPGDDAPSNPAPAPPTFVPVPDSAAQGQPVQGQPYQGNQAAPPPGSYPPGPAAPMAGPPPPTIVYAQVMPGYIMRPPRVPPQPGMVVVGYETTSPEVGCCKCEDLNIVGWMSVFLLAFFFFPLCWLPCLVDGCHDPSCRPVYGWPNQQQPQQGYQQQFGAPQQYPVVAPPP